MVREPLHQEDGRHPVWGTMAYMLSMSRCVVLGLIVLLFKLCLVDLVVSGCPSCVQALSYCPGVLVLK